MIRVQVHLSIGMVGCRRTEILEFEDDTTEEEIESDCKDWMLDNVQWGFERLPEKLDKSQG